MSADHEVSAGPEASVGRLGGRWRISPTIEKAFDPRNNALNAWRLAMAMGVVLWHSWPITGRTVSFEPAHQLLRDMWVDGFFAMSGFLITWSWFKHPRLRDFCIARALRILPGFWVCLMVIAFVIAPLGVALQGGSPGRLLLSLDPIKYVLANIALQIQQPGIAGTPTGVPWPGDWDSPLWTLSWEALCYILIAGLGVLGLLRRRWLTTALLALAILWSALLPPVSALLHELPPGVQQIDAATAGLIAQGVAARFAVMFLSGTFLYQFRNVIPARFSLVAVCVIVVLAASLLPNYRLVAAIPLAYALIVSGALIRNKWLNLRTDLSYGVYIYAWPVQQLLVICGLAFLNPLVFAVVATITTLPLAALSWFVVEKPSLALKTRLLRKKNAAPLSSQPG